MRIWVLGVGFRVEGYGFRVRVKGSGSGFRPWRRAWKVCVVGFRVKG